MTPLLCNWFEERAGDVPSPLRNRLRAIVDTVGEADTVSQQVRQMVSVVALEVGRIRERSCTERRDALNLLTTDALISYVMEFAAPLGPDLLDELAGKLMRMAAGSTVPHASDAT